MSTHWTSQFPLAYLKILSDSNKFLLLVELTLWQIAVVGTAMLINYMITLTF